jgi:hypothetical protein
MITRESLHEYPGAAPDRGGIRWFRVFELPVPPRQVSVIVRYHVGSEVSEVVQVSVR